jgi:hypothetical protein
MAEVFPDWYAKNELVDTPQLVNSCCTPGGTVTLMSMRIMFSAPAAID